MMKRAAISAVLLAFALRPAVAEPAPNGGDKDRIEQARASLQERLSDAQSKGVVLLKGDAGPSAHRGEAARVLRLGDANPVSCLTPVMLAETAALVEKEPSRTIDALQNVLVDGRDGDRGELELQLATAFLVIGFAEEAAAVAAGRKDARAAAIVSLARLMSGAPPVADGAAAYVGCGDFYQMIAQVEAMLAGGAVEITDSEIGFLKSLPPPIAAPIAEALALAALDRGDPRAAARLKEIVARSAPSSRRADASAFIDTALRQPALADEAVRGALAPIAAEPGPLQERALTALAPLMADAADAEARAAFDHDLEDAAASRSPDNSGLSLLLAERREQRGDIAGSVRQLAKTQQIGAAKDGAEAAAARRMLGAELRSGSADRRLQAMAAIAAEPAFAATALGAADLALVVDELVAFGDAEALDVVLLAHGVAIRSRSASVARALLRAGRAQEAADLARSGAGDAALAETLFRARAFGIEPAHPYAAQGAGRPDLLAREAMRRGDWDAAERHFARLGAGALVGQNAERMATAALANGRLAPPAAALAALQRSGSDLPGFFVPAQRQPASRVPENVAREIAYVRQRISHE